MPADPALGRPSHTILSQRSDALVRALGEVAYEWNPRTHEAHWDGDYTRILGYSSEEIGNDTASWMTRIHPDDLPRVMAEVEHASADRRMGDLEYRVRHRDGHYVWMHDRGVFMFDEAGALDYVIGVLRDVSGRKADEQRIRQLNRTYAVLSDINQLIVREHDPQAILDNACATAIDKGDFKLAWIGLRDPSSSALRLAAHAGSASDMADTLRCVQAHFEYCSFASRAFATRTHAVCNDIATDPEAASFRDEALARGFRSLASLALIVSGEAVGVMTLYADETGVFDEREMRLLDELAGDIAFALQVQRRETEHRRLEAQLRQAQKMDALGRLAGGIAHDFNNILAALAGYTTLIEMDAPPASSIHGSVREIKSALGRAADLVRRILDFSRPQGDKREPVDLAAVIVEAARLLRTTMSPRIELRTELATEVPQVLADPSQVHQVLINLGTNASHALLGGRGLLEITTSVVHVSVATASVSASLREGTYVRVSVRDTGHGISAENLEHLFEPFFTTKAPSEGTGLGLSIVHAIMRSHGGAVTVYSQPGAGTTFHLYFPALTTQAAQPQAAIAATPRGQGEHVVYVDDEPSLAFVAARILEQLGYEVTTCAGAAAALRLCSDGAAVDLVVTDLAMPDMTGIDLAAALHKQRPDLPVALVTGYLSPQDSARARDAGIHHVAMKPSTVEELGTVVAAALGRPRAAG